MNELEPSLKAKGWWQAQDGSWNPPKHNLGTGSSEYGKPETLRGEIHPRLEKSPPARIRQSRKPLLNKLETEWFALPEADGFLPQAVRFRLGNGIWYKPDGFNFKTLIAVEVKGPHSFRGGFENLKVAASLYQMIRWRLVWKQNGQWQEQDVLP